MNDSGNKIRMFKDKVLRISNKLKEVKVKENFSSFSIEFETDQIINHETKLIQGFIDKINPDDDFSLIIQIDNGDAITLREKVNLDSYIEKLNADFKYYEEGEIIRIKLEIFKHKGLNIRIYSYSDFKIFFEELELLKKLEILNDLFQSNSKIRLETIEPNIKPFCTANFTLNSELPTSEININENLFSENCHFGNSDKYSVNPYHFHPTKTDNLDFKKSFDSLCCLFSMIYVFDISSITDARLYYKINGFKAIKGEVEINNDLQKRKDLFFEIFEWCYSSEGNVADKIGIARNIISIHFKEKLLDLDKGVLTSVKSAFKTYLKENVSKYIELRGKIQDELNWISQKSGEIVDRYISSYQKSIFTFLSFFISVFVLRIISKANTSSIFNKDATLLSLAFLGLSIVFLTFSSLNLSVEKKRLKRKYKNLKERFKDLLVQKDIDNILANDTEFEYEIGYIEKRHKIYLWLWILTIVILLITVVAVSDYLTLELLKNKTSG